MNKALNVIIPIKKEDYFSYKNQQHFFHIVDPSPGRYLQV
jgi:hypothetical protein